MPCACGDAHRCLVDWREFSQSLSETFVFQALRKNGALVCRLVRLRRLAEESGQPSLEGVSGHPSGCTKGRCYLLGRVQLSAHP